MKSAKLFNSGVYLLSFVALVASFYFSYFAFFAFLPFIFMLETQNDSFQTAFFSFSFFFAFLYFGVFKSLYVYYNLNIIFSFLLYILLVFYHFLYIYLAVFIYKRLKFHLLFFPFILICFEYLKSSLLYGLPVGNFSILVYNIPWFTKSAAYFGSYFVGLSLIFVNTAVYMLIKKDKLSFAVLVIFLAVLLLPYSKITNSFSEHIAIAQGGIPQQEKWDRGYLERNLHIYLNESSVINKGVIFWPESAYPYLFEEDNNILSNFVEQKNIALVTGLVRKQDSSFLNSAALITKEGISYYNKQHLVPFAEFIPLRNIIGKFIPKNIDPGDFKSGSGNVILQYNKLKIAPMICYEEAFSDISRKYKLDKANLLAVLTNDAWFENTPTFYMLHRNSVFRAVESSMWLVRVANTGLSEIITPKGKIYADLPVGKRALLYKNVKITCTKPTFFDSYGYMFARFLLLFVSLLIFYRIYMLRKQKAQGLEAR